MIHARTDKIRVPRNDPDSECHTSGVILTLILVAK